MTGYHLNHINIRTADLEATRDFYAEVFGLEEGFRPPFPTPGYWMYAGDQPIVHISPCDPESPARTNPDGMGNGLDHFAMWGSGLADQLATLDRRDIEYRKVLAGGGRRSRLLRVPGDRDLPRPPHPRRRARGRDRRARAQPRTLEAVTGAV